MSQLTVCIPFAASPALTWGSASLSVNFPVSFRAMMLAAIRASAGLAGGR